MYKTAIIGVGFIGAAHIEALRRLGNIEIVALADPINAEKKAASLNVPKGYADYKEMIDTEKPDVIHVCTPNETHFEVSMYAMERGIHVLCEKPLAMSVEEGKKMAEAAKKYGVWHGVNLINRFYPMAYQMREALKNGDAGQIFSIQGGYWQDWLALETDYNWRLETKMSGTTRAVADIGSHWMDLMEFVTGQRISEVIADFATFFKTRKKPTKPLETFSNMLETPDSYEDVPIDTEDYASFLFRTDAGAYGTCIISQVFQGRKNKLLLGVSGSKSSLQWDSEDVCNLWIGHRERANEILNKDPSLLSPNTVKINGFPGGHTEGYPDTLKQLFKAFYEAISNKQESGYEYADFNAGLRQMVLGEALLKSSKERTWVEI
jgi:predicted dehydrogenase